MPAGVSCGPIGRTLFGSRVFHSMPLAKGCSWFWVITKSRSLPGARPPDRLAFSRDVSSRSHLATSVHTATGARSWIVSGLSSRFSIARYVVSQWAGWGNVRYGSVTGITSCVGCGHEEAGSIELRFCTRMCRLSGVSLARMTLIRSSLSCARGLCRSWRISPCPSAWYSISAAVIFTGMSF